MAPRSPARRIRDERRRLRLAPGPGPAPRSRRPGMGRSLDCVQPNRSEPEGSWAAWWATGCQSPGIPTDAHGSPGTPCVWRRDRLAATHTLRTDHWFAPEGSTGPVARSHDTIASPTGGRFAGPDPGPGGAWEDR